MKQYVMAIHTKNGATVVTPDKFAIENRCKRLKRELTLNKKSEFKRWGGCKVKKVIISAVLLFCSFSSFASTTMKYYEAKDAVEKYYSVAYGDTYSFIHALEYMKSVDNGIASFLGNGQDCKYIETTMIANASESSRKENPNKVVDKLHTKLVKSVSSYITAKCKEYTE